ncbi:MAG TPA: hypothetical protein VEC14_01075 [Reyranellaceae bacterium]|nr:hypothetical protein [Reyranellaceae bacterium]
MSEVLLLNPRKRRKARKARKSSRRRRRHVAVAAPAPRRRRRRSRKVRNFRIRARRNPIIPTGLVETHIKPAAYGALGALANDVLVGFASKYLPAQLQLGEVRHLTKMGVAIVAGMVAEKSIGRGIARAATVGALTCVMHDFVRAQFQKAMPSVALGSLGEQFDVPALGEQFDEPALGFMGEQFAVGDQLSGMFDASATGSLFN